MTERYTKLKNEYFTCEARKRKIRMEIEKLQAQLELTEMFSNSLNDILCTDGKHIYEHFEEVTDESQEVAEKDDR